MSILAYFYLNDDWRTLMTHQDTNGEDRREFLKSCGKFAAVTPSAMTLLLSTSLTSTAKFRRPYCAWQ